MYRRAAQMKALARHGQWRTALRLFGRMRSSAAAHRRITGREHAPEDRPGIQAQARGSREGRGAQAGGPARGSQPRGPLGSDAAPDDISYTLAAAICARNQLWHQARALLLFAH